MQLTRMRREISNPYGVNLNDASLKLNLPLWHNSMQGSTIYSKDLNRYSCAVTGATWGYQGRLFGADDKITVGTTPFAYGEYTIEFWMKWTTDPTGSFKGLVSFRNVDSNQVGISFFGNFDNNLYLYLNETGTVLCVFSGTSIRNTNWNHYIIYNPGGNPTVLANAKCYINTVSLSPGSITNGTPATWNEFVLGRNNGTSVGATFGEFRMYSGNEIALCLNNYLTTRWRY